MKNTQTKKPNQASIQQTPIQPEKIMAKITLPIAVTMPLQGQHIIEASAGTGKTWTLTGILLRLIVEEGYACEKIIATTFTRAAATEMRERIRGRLLEMSQLLQLYPTALENMAKKIAGTEAFDSHAVNFSAYQLANNMLTQTEIFTQFFEELGELLPSDKTSQDLLKEPIYQHLLKLILHTEFAETEANEEAGFGDTLTEPPNPDEKLATSKSKQDPKSPPTKNLSIRQASYRTNIALNQLDKLFVGTLDSLCQKWLREFSAETGFQPDITINTNPQSIILNVVHDQLRGYRAWLASQQPELFAVMFEHGLLATAEDFLSTIDKAMTFYSTPIDEIAWQDFDISAVNQLIEQINDADRTPLEPYLHAEYRKAQGMAGGRVLTKNFEMYGEILTLLQNNDWQALLSMQEPHKTWLTQVAQSVNQGTGFNKNKDSEQHAFASIPLVGLLAQLSEKEQALQRHFQQVNLYFAQFISRYIKSQLPLLLEAQRQTTFSLQLARLNDALASKQGATLARYIRHQYPIALIDESQDINTEQAMLLQRIYLTKLDEKRDKKSDCNTQEKSGFLLLVGDPKQAIYGFRGGDVNNYNQLKHQFNSDVQVLNKNFRSSPSLVNQLNHWFGVPDIQLDTAIDNQLKNQHAKSQMPSDTTAETALLTPSAPYWLGEQIVYRHTQAARESSNLSRETQKYSQNELDNNANSSDVFLLPVDYHAPRPIISAEPSQDNAESVTAEPEDILEEDTIDFSDVVTAQILALMMDENIRIVDETSQDDIRLLQMNDICILGVTSRQLTAIEQKLHLKGVATTRGGTQSIFTDRMTQDMLVLMQALLYPYDLARIKSLLLTRFFGLDMVSVQAMFEQHAQQDSINPVRFFHEFGNNKQDFTLETVQLLIRETGRRWQSVGFLSAIQWFLNQCLKNSDNNESTPSSFWQRLAAQPDGERLLIDLRQLMDVISQQAKNLGEHQLLVWLQRMQAECPIEEWSVQQRLPSENGVSLMTIHQSKGLEFSIVFVVGLDKKPYAGNAKYPLYLYNFNKLTDDKISKNSITAGGKTTLQNRRLSAVPFLQKGNLNNATRDEDYFVTVEKNELYEEKLRLAYVALTRAKDRLYIVAQAADKNYSAIPLNQWLEDKDFKLPERLQDIIPVVDINSLSKYLQPNLLYHAIANESKAENPSTNELQEPLANYQQWINAITKTKFQGWSNTSFTALSKQLDGDKYDSAVNMPDYDGLEQALDMGELESERLDKSIGATTEDNNNTAESQLLRFTFEKGANAGTFLHTILEMLPPLVHPPSVLPDEALPLISPIEDLTPENLSLWLPPKAWQNVIDRVVDNSHIDTLYRSRFKDSDVASHTEQSPISPHHVALGAWLYHILHTPLLATGVPISAIPSEQRYHELSFSMSLTRNFNIVGLNALLKDYHIPIKLQSKSQLSYYWRYLRGEIDLVYEHNEQFFVVDYKSNYLGNQYANYHTTALETAMTEHGYWLQASIYQVALHRYLTLRLPDYNIYQHLGTVEYAFLRGMHPKQPDMGRLAWQPEPKFILALDDLFGRAGE